MQVRSFRDLVVWQKGLDLAAEVYSLTTQFPRSEQFRLVDQITRSAASVAANVAEGHERGTRKDYANFVAIARGSLAETQTFLFLAERLGYVAPERCRAVQTLAEEVSKMLNSLLLRLRRPNP